MWVPHAQELSGPLGADMSSSQCLNNKGSVPANVNATPDFSKSPCASRKTNKAKEARARGWLLRLMTSAPNKIIPSDEQRLVLEDVMDRCLQERDDEQQELNIRSEPSRLFLHGVPGAGKSKLLEWIRLFFEEVCGWTHGVEFVHLASQHTMTAQIGGFTIHSFGNVKFRQKDGSLANVRKEKSKDMNAQFLKYERLRWVFIDECSTASVENQAEMEHNIRTSTRQEHTWAMRPDGAVRSWGGVNLFEAGDMWQFRPVNATAIFDNPFKPYVSSGVQDIMAAFWTKSKDSTNFFRELSAERRCKDP